jgi:hydroxymethylglutaryl-CoA lyase
VARVRDVTLRDGLQSLPVVVPTDAKVAVYRQLLAAGIEEAQVTSFVSPQLLPQMADAEDLWRGIKSLPGSKGALIVNLRGYRRARAVGVDQLEMVLALSGTYHQKNSGRSREETWAEITQMAADAEEEDVHLAVVLANTWYCHFEGETPLAHLLSRAEQIAGLGVAELGLADTTGAAHPDEVYRRVRAVRDRFPDFFLQVHLHEGGRGMENAQAVVDAGGDGFDAALLGLGGSPFAGELVGNLDLRRLHEAGLVQLNPSGLSEAEGVLQEHLTAAGVKISMPR